MRADESKAHTGFFGYVDVASHPCRLREMLIAALLVFHGVRQVAWRGRCAACRRGMLTVQKEWRAGGSGS